MSDLLNTTVNLDHIRASALRDTGYIVTDEQRIVQAIKHEIEQELSLFPEDDHRMVRAMATRVAFRTARRLAKDVTP